MRVLDQVPEQILTHKMIAMDTSARQVTIWMINVDEHGSAVSE